MLGIQAALGSCVGLVWCKEPTLTEEERGRGDRRVAGCRNLDQGQGGV